MTTALERQSGQGLGRQCRRVLTAMCRSFGFISSAVVLFCRVTRL